MSYIRLWGKTCEVLHACESIAQQQSVADTDTIKQGVHCRSYATDFSHVSNVYV